MATLDINSNPGRNPTSINSLGNVTFPSNPLKIITDSIDSHKKPLLALAGVVGMLGSARLKPNLPEFGNEPAISATLVGVPSKFNQPKALNGAVSESLFRQAGVSPHFMNMSDWKPYTDEYRIANLKNGETPLTWDQVEALKNGVTVMIYNSKSARHVVGRPLEQTAAIINGELNKFLELNGCGTLTKDMRGILEMRAASAWTVRNTQYHFFPERDGDLMTNTSDLMAQPAPRVECTDSAVIARDIARKLSVLSGSELKCYFVSGTLLPPSDSPWDGRSVRAHALIGGILASRMKMLSDSTPNSLAFNQGYNWANSTKTFLDCPTSEAHCELFLASFCPGNGTEQWKEMKARKFQPRPGIDLRQGDPQIYLMLGTNLASATGHWHNWLENQEPFRNALKKLQTLCN